MIDAEFIRRLAAEQALDIPEEDLIPLAIKFADQMNAIRTLRRLDLVDVSPGIAFDVRWDR